MFEQLKGLWQSVMGRSATVDEDERRIWVRHPSKVETRLQSVGNGVDTRLSARVRNVSKGGMLIFVDHAFEPGDMISMDLPCEESGTSESVLACVVHVTELESGGWALGCEFSEELPRDHLIRLGAPRDKASTKDQRIARRYECPVHATYEVSEKEGKSERPVEVQNISLRGIGLVMREPIQTGSLLNLSLRGPHSKNVHRILACVVHVSHQPGQEWMVGCNFINELSDNDMQALA